MRRKVASLFLIAVILILSTNAVFAAAPSISADDTYFDFNTGLYILTGNVRVEQRERVITADQAKVNLAGFEVWGSGNVSLSQDDIYFSGNSVYVFGKQHLAQIEGGVNFMRSGIQISANRVDFNWRSKIATFYGNVKVVQDGNSWSADKVTYNVRTNSLL